MLRKVEGMVTQMVDNHWVEMVNDTEPLVGPSKSTERSFKFLEFTGVEDWRGKRVDLSELVGMHVRCYGWEDQENEFKVLTIKVVNHLE